MASLSRHLRLRVPPADAFALCLRLLTEADPERGVVARRCEPDPPRRDGLVVSTVHDRRGERTLRARIVELDPPHVVATAAEDEGPAVRTTLRVGAADDGATVTLRSEATAGLGMAMRATTIVDRLLLGRAQRRAARATLRRLRALADAEPGAAGLSDRGGR